MYGEGLQFGISLESLGHMTWNPLEKKQIFRNKYSYKIEEAVKCNTNRSDLFVPYSNTIRHWFIVTGSYDMEAIEKKRHCLKKNIFLPNKYTAHWQSK